MVQLYCSSDTATVLKNTRFTSKYWRVRWYRFQLMWYGYRGIWTGVLITETCHLMRRWYHLDQNKRILFYSSLRKDQCFLKQLRSGFEFELPIPFPTLITVTLSALSNKIFYYHREKECSRLKKRMICLLTCITPPPLPPSCKNCCGSPIILPKETKHKNKT